MPQPQSQDEGAMFARLRRGRRARAAGAVCCHLPGRGCPGRGLRAQLRAETGRRRVWRQRPAHEHGWLLAPPAAAQEAGVLVAEKIDSGEKPSLSSCSRGCG